MRRRRFFSGDFSWKPPSVRAQPESLALVLSSQRDLTPLAIVEIPPSCLRQSSFKIVLRLPPEIRANLRRVDRVAAVVTGAVGHEGFQLGIALLSLSLQSDVVGGGEDRFDLRAESINDLQICPLVAAADVVLLARLSIPQRQKNPRAMVFD